MPKCEINEGKAKKRKEEGYISFLLNPNYL